MSKLVSLYLRVSTNLQNCDNQEHDLRKFCDMNNYQIVDVYKDQGISGAKASRPELNRMLEDAEKGRFKILLVARLDRVGRNLKNIMELLSRLNEYGVSFISRNENIDLTTPAGVFTMQVLGALCQYERSLIRARIKDTMTRLKEEGKIKLGRPRVGFDTEQAIKMRKEGYGIREISKSLNISIGKLHKFLKSADVQKGCAYNTF